MPTLQTTETSPECHSSSKHGTFDGIFEKFNEVIINNSYENIGQNNAREQKQYEEDSIQSVIRIRWHSHRGIVSCRCQDQEVFETRPKP